MKKYFKNKRLVSIAIFIIAVVISISVFFIIENNKRVAKVKLTRAVIYENISDNDFEEVEYLFNELSKIASEKTITKVKKDIE